MAAAGAAPPMSMAAKVEAVREQLAVDPGALHEVVAACAQGLGVPHGAGHALVAVVDACYAKMFLGA